MSSHPDQEPRTDDAEAPERSDAKACAPYLARRLIDDIRALQEVADLEDHGLEDTRLEELGLDPGGADPLADQAARLLDGKPMAMDTIITFHLILEMGLSWQTLCFECIQMPADGGGYTYDCMRIYYRYSCIEAAIHCFSGEDAVVAKAYGRRVLPELRRPTPAATLKRHCRERLELGDAERG